MYNIVISTERTVHASPLIHKLSTDLSTFYPQDIHRDIHRLSTGLGRGGGICYIINLFITYNDNDKWKEEKEDICNIYLTYCLIKH